MIVCSHTTTNHQWSEQELTGKLMYLPVSLRQAVLQKRIWTDLQLSISGKLLLKEVLKNLGKANLSLADLKNNAYHRPYFDADVDFNITHSGNIVVCCGTDEGKIGVDIEQIKGINLTEYTDHFTQNEWNRINNSADRFVGFYQFWTRKEAVLKAIGTGFHTPLSSIDIADDDIDYDGTGYHIQSLDIAPGYQCHIAATIKQPKIQLTSVNLES